MLEFTIVTHFLLQIFFLVNLVTAIGDGKTWL